MLNLLQKLRMISGGKVVAALCAGALAASAANPAAAYDQVCFYQKSIFTTMGINLRKLGETNPDAPLWDQRVSTYPHITAGTRKCLDVRGKMKPGEPFNIQSRTMSGPDPRCKANGGRGDGTARWPAGGGTLELEGHGTSGHSRCVITEYKMWDGCADDSRGGFSQFGCQDWQPKMHQHAAYDYAQKKNIAYLRSVLQRGANPNVGRYGNETPLHATLRRWRTSHMEALLDAGADPMLKDHEGRTALRALIQDHGYRDDALKMFKKMIQARVSRGEQSARLINEGAATGGVPAMINIVLTQNADLVEFALAQGGDAGATTYSRYSPMHHAVKFSQRMVQRLLYEGADPNMATRNGFGTPLHWAVDPRFAKNPLLDGDRDGMVADMLLAGANANAKNGQGQTPLHFAAQRGEVRIVGNMLNRGGKPNIADNDGLTPLHYAALAGHARVMEQLIKRGADPSLKDKNGNTPEELASR